MASESHKIDQEELKKLFQDEAMRLPDMGICVSGLAGRFPKSDSVSEFEEHLVNGVDMINDNDNARFTCGLWNLPPRAGRLKDLTKFDCEFFGFTPEEANYIDFQLRILYEVVYESILDAGVNPSTLRGTNTGVFFGLHCNEFESAMADDPNMKSGGYFAQFAVKIAQYFDLRGMTVTFDAACASGFVGLHNAVQALKEGVIEQAIVCSSNIPIHPVNSFIFLQMQMLSPTGYSRFLDSRADGYVKSEACVSMLLQRDSVAIRNYASFMATELSVDGYKKEGVTFPSDQRQEDLIRSTKELAGISTNHIEYLEAHGTGTPAGDPQEARAIANVYYPTELEVEPEEERRVGPLLVGSVKTNMGHSEAVSGLCSLTKAVLMLENELIYKSLHYEKPNHNIQSLMDGRLVPVVENIELRAKIIPLSCYGFGGANVHVIVRANNRPAVEPDEVSYIVDKSPRLVVMFGRSREALESFFSQLLDSESRSTRNCLSDDFLALLDTLNSSSVDRMMEYRGYLVLDRGASDPKSRELARAIKKCQLAPASSLDDTKQQQLVDLGRRAHVQDCAQRVCNLVFSGLECQWAGMAEGLRNYEQFWGTIERLANILEPFKSEVDLINLLVDPSEGEASKTMTGTFVSIVAYQIALTNIIRDQLKLENLTKFVGHSLGEISCAYAAGIFSEREAIMVAYRIGKTLDTNRHLIGGKMVVLSLSEEEALRKVIGHYKTVRVSCVNGPKSVTVSGSSEEMDSLCATLEQEKTIYMKQLDCSIALHNEVIMGPEIELALKEALQVVLFPLADYPLDQSRWVSTVAADATRANAEYFATNLCKKVDFLGALNQLADDSITIELAPSGLFESQLLQVMSSAREGKSKFHYAKLMKQSTPAEDQALFMTKSIGELYQLGAIFDLNHFYHAQKKLQFPVRRQVPSLSSLFRWDRQHSLFVPRYPIHFSKSSAKCEIPVDIVNDRDKYLTDHCVEGRILFPATGYLLMIWRVFSFTKRNIYDSCFHEVEDELVPIEFHNVRLMRAIILGNRVAQVYVHFEEATGRFEIKEGGSTVVEGYARTPVDSPDGLLYEEVKDRLRAENLELVLNKEDIYKQFRVSGYDYGEKFQNIESASSDGRFCRVKFNSYFASLTDSILQSIFLAISRYAPSGGLFLPTRFDYVRFQPKVILDKIRAANMCFDLCEKTLNPKARREIMMKIMQRGQVKEGEELDMSAELKLAEEQRMKEYEETKLDCVFDTYCDPVMNIIITDGIEMRGVRAMPAPRRSDNNEVHLESYQFVADIETPVLDENLTQHKSTIEPYAQICDSMSLDLLAKLSGKPKLNLNGLTCGSVAPKDIETYKAKHLSSIYKARESKEEKHDAEDHHYDIKKNGARMLMSVLDQLCGCGDRDPKGVAQLVQKNRQHLMQDLIQSPLTGERFMRPLVELVIENSCTKKGKLRMLEVNLDDGLLKEPIQLLIQSIAPTVTLDYALAHPEPGRLSHHKALSGTQTRTYQLKDLQSLFNDNPMGELDFIVYKDISCYSLPKQVVEQNGLAPVLRSLNGSMRLGGFIVVVMRQRLTLAERILLALCEPELVGITKKDLEKLGADNRGKATDLTAVNKLEHINTILASRYKQMLAEAERNNMICLADKSDENGCTVLLFKTTGANESSDQNTDESKERQGSLNLKQIRTEQVLLRVTHNDQESIGKWLTKLKEIFKPVTKEESANKDEAVKEQDKEEKGEQEAKVIENPHENTTVWLCAVATKQNPINGLVGMFQALGKELGWARLRCYYDCHSFKDMDEPVTEEAIERCPRFQECLKRDVCWNCIDSRGNFGAFRHFSVNQFMSYENCLCSNNSEDSDMNSTHAYAYNSVRGDLSSFTWFEAPHKYMSESEHANTVKVAYAALNFRDIMLATGRLPLDAIPLSSAMSDCQIGLEFSGIDARGKRIAGMVPSRSLATRLLCAEQSSIQLEVPEWLSLREAATIPVVYATVIMALVSRGRIKRGETILIHAGSGGVGQAAIRMAAHYGLEIFTTVGTPEKRKFLLEQFPGVIHDDHMFSSRDCDFETRLMEMTHGRGVDLVLNSLADDKLQASVRCLADGGRFLEIGKYDMSVDARLELLQLDDNKTFHGILLDKLFEAEDISPFFKRQFDDIVRIMGEGLEEGWVRPIVHTVFKHNQMEEAFRFMATGKHIGKVLIEIDSTADDLARGQQEANSPRTSAPKPALSCVPRCHFDSQKSYIVTGGLGGFGLELTKWLVGQGVRYLLLTSRTGVRTGYQRSTIKRLTENQGARVEVISEEQADACTPDGATKLCELARDLSPRHQVGGIFHLALVLKDTLLENMSTEDFARVCRPKVAMGAELDRASRQLSPQLDYFVCFSSVTSGKGNAGQSNYAYANSCLERLCEQRRQVGQHGLAIQWGAIGDVGVAYENLGGNDVIVGGTRPQRIPSCLATLSRILASPFAVCLSVVPVNRGGGQGGEKGDLVAAIMHVLGIKDPSKVSEQATLGELGLDSLMAVEIRQYIEREYEMTLNIQEIRALTIAKIRDISENGKPAALAAKAAAASAETATGAASDQSALGNSAPSDGPRTVESYGNLAGDTPSGGAQAQAPATALSNLLAPGGLANGLSAANIPATLDTNNVSSFRPDLELPKADYVRLNYTKQQHPNGSTSASAAGCTTSARGAPIFFLPPVHGRFDRLELVCANITRPCVGLNWTRKLGRVQTVAEAVEIYLDLLSRSNWARDFELPGGASADEPNERVVDLVGYSFGATIAFELMLAIHKMERRAQRRLANGVRNDDNASGGLRAGRLILLDGSPKQIELGSRMIDVMSARSRYLNLADKVDELLVYFTVMHTSDRQGVDYIGLQRDLSKVSIEEKVRVASERLVDLLELTTTSNGRAGITNGEVGDESDDDEEVDSKQVQIAHAMEAFCRRYEIITNYKATASLPGDCTLIRADKVYLKNADQFREDLDLSSVVKGRVSLHVMRGDHESFLDNNQREIGEIIEATCGGGKSTSNQ